MNTKKRLNCYVFSNLIVSFLSLNVLVNDNTSSELVKKMSCNTLNKIYEKENVVEVVSVSPVTISNEQTSNVISVSNKVVQSKNVSSSVSYVKPSYNSVTGTNLVNYAKKFIGLRYVSAGNSLATGTDCSGFTRLIYKEFGINLGRTVSSQVYSGTYVNKKDLQPGDLVFYSYGSVASHVAIYIGNGQIIHESTPRDGVKISSVNIMNYITARRLITSNVTSSVAEKKQEIVEKKQEIVETKQEIVEKNKETKKIEEKKNDTTNVKDKIEENEKKETNNLNNNVEQKLEDNKDKNVSEVKEVVKTKDNVEKDKSKIIIEDKKNSEENKEVVNKEIKDVSVDKKEKSSNQELVTTDESKLLKK